VQTPRFCGLPFKAGLLLFVVALSRDCLTSWLIVGILSGLA